MNTKKQSNCYCANCGKGLRRNPYRIKRTPNQYCNRGCFYQFLEKNRTGNLTAICNNCGGDVVGLPKQRTERNSRFYCSRDCWQQGQRNRLPVQCAHCKLIIELAPSVTKNEIGNFCNMVCYGAWRKENFKGNKNPNWRHGHAGTNNKSDYGSNWRRQRNAAINRDGGRCQVCKVTESANGYELDVHHIIPFRMFNYVKGVNDNHKKANQLSNLITLCRACHKLIERRVLSLPNNFIHSAEASAA